MTYTVIIQFFFFSYVCSIGGFKVIYRISDPGPTTKLGKTKCQIFHHFQRIFTDYEIHLIADNLKNETLSCLLKFKRVANVTHTNLYNSASFLFAVDYAIKNFRDDDKVYLAEDDYFYTLKAPLILGEGFGIADYVSGYDHPDKYVNGKNGGNPYVEDGGEMTRVVVTAHHHWKFTNSCCMTFGVLMKTMKEDLAIYKKYCAAPRPYDFAMFIALQKQNKRKIASPIPGVSTHGEAKFLTPFIDWSNHSIIL